VWQHPRGTIRKTRRPPCPGGAAAVSPSAYLPNGPASILLNEAGPFANDAVLAQPRVGAIQEQAEGSRSGRFTGWAIIVALIAFIVVILLVGSR
jgi:hypothetical protein